MNKFRIVSTAVLAAAIINLAGCAASVPMATLEDERQSRTFTVGQQQSAIYLFRNEGFGMAIPVVVSINGLVAGQTSAYTYFKWSLTPGIYIIKSYAENVETTKINAIPGRIHYIRQEIKMGANFPKTILYEVSESEGKQAISECRMAASEIDGLNLVPH